VKSRKHPTGTRRARRGTTYGFKVLVEKNRPHPGRASGRAARRRVINVFALAIRKGLTAED